MKRLLLVFLLLPFFGIAQTNYSKDVKSVDGVIAALYDVISGEPGAPRDWARFRNLFASDAKLIPTRKNEEGKLIYKVLTPDEYVQLFSSRIATGFFEREIYRKADDFGTIVHAFSTYETKEKKDGPVTNRGINSIQIFYDGSRYYVMNIFWCAESMGFTLPEKYLSK